MQRDVPPVVNVDHDLRLPNAVSNGISHTVTSCGPQRGEVGEIAHKSLMGLGVDIDVAVGPEHAVANLVAQAHDRKVNAGLLEALEGAGDVAAERGSQWFD